MVPALLHPGDPLRHDPGQEGHEGHDGGAGHELGDLVDALVDRLELLLLGVEPPPAGDRPEDVDHGHVQLVAHRDGLADLTGESGFVAFSYFSIDWSRSEG